MTLPICRAGDSCTGHGCWPPRPNVQGSPDTFVNLLPWHRQTDQWGTHCCPPPPPACHDSRLAHGSPTVFINLLEAGRVGDPVACGSLVAAGSPDSFCGPDPW